MKKISLLFIMSLILGACSFSNSSKEVVSTKPSDELEFVVDGFSETPATEIKVEEQKIVEAKVPDEMIRDEKPTEKIKENIGSKIEEGKEQALALPEEPKFKNYQNEEAPKITSLEKTEKLNLELGKEELYHVQKGDTLMMVAFKIYGDYRKWKDLKSWNESKLKIKMGSGTVLKYYLPGTSFGWGPSGLPYLVKSGDTLGTVSMDKYGTSKKWKSIYENNRPLIRDPNLIFAGFTIYYVPSRDIASEHR